MFKKSTLFLFILFVSASLSASYAADDTGSDIEKNMNLHKPAVTLSV